MALGLHLICNPCSALQHHYSQQALYHHFQSHGINVSRTLFIYCIYSQNLGRKNNDRSQFFPTFTRLALGVSKPPLQRTLQSVPKQPSSLFSTSETFYNILPISTMSPLHFRSSLSQLEASKFLILKPLFYFTYYCNSCVVVCFRLR